MVEYDCLYCGHNYDLIDPLQEQDISTQAYSDDLIIATSYNRALNVMQCINVYNEKKFN